MADFTYPSQLRSVRQVLQRLEAGVVHGEGLEVNELLEEGLVLGAELANFGLIEDELAELAGINEVRLHLRGRARRRAQSS